MIAAVSSWPPEKTSAISATRTRSSRSTASGLSISTRTPFGTEAGPDAAEEDAQAVSLAWILLLAGACHGRFIDHLAERSVITASSGELNAMRRNSRPDQSPKSAGSLDARCAARSRPARA